MVKNLMKIICLLMVVYIGFQEKYAYVHYHGQLWFKVMIIAVPLIFLTVMAVLIRKCRFNRYRQKWALIVLGICVAALLLLNVMEFLY